MFIRQDESRPWTEDFKATQGDDSSCINPKVVVSLDHDDFRHSHVDSRSYVRYSSGLCRKFSVFCFSWVRHLRVSENIKMRILCHEMPSQNESTPISQKETPGSPHVFLPRLWCKVRTIHEFTTIRKLICGACQASWDTPWSSLSLYCTCSRRYWYEEAFPVYFLFFLWVNFQVSSHDN